jgi:hypothetical protein
MNQREALLILFEATADAPETTPMRRARRWAEKRLEVLRRRYARRHTSVMLGKFQEHLDSCTQCLTRPRCPVGEEFLTAGLRAADEALGQPPGTLSADLPES